MGALRRSMGNAFMEMLGDTIVGNLALDAVGDFLIAFRSVSEGFRYCESGQAFPFNNGAVRPPPGEWAQIPIGGAAEGGYSYSVMTPRAAGACAVGVHFDQGRFGALMCPAISRDVVLIEGVDHREFAEAVRASFGYDLHGPHIMLGDAGDQV